MVYMSSLALSVLLSLVSAVAYAAGAIVQERVATASDGRSLAPLRDRVWWAAVALNGVGALLHVVALAYGPLSLVQPLGALTIVFALPMAALFVRRKAGASAWRGALMATVGLAGLLALTGSSDAHFLGGSEQLMLALVTFGAVVALMLIAKAMRRPVMRSVVLAGASGVAFGIASVFTKTVAMQWTSGSVGAGVPTLLVIAALAGAGLLLAQAAYRGAGLTAPLATVTVVNPVVAAAVGITLFGEQFRHGTAGTVLALVCGAVAAGGLVMLTTERMSAERREAQHADGGERPQTVAHASEPSGGPAVDARGREPMPAGASGEGAGDFVGPAGSPAPAGAPIDPAGALPRPVRSTAPTVVTFPPAGPRAPVAAEEKSPALLSLPVRMPLEGWVGHAESGPDPRPLDGAARKRASSAGSAASAAVAGDSPGVQTLTPPALR
ncbi:DMT family transporter [Streptomyces sp. NPDC005803]|uniref:DMT family transporter n=1 Tax=Streptomyces sp. NPDC005803 TaxID=3154297 RepID=UPI0033F2FC9C